MIQMGLGIGVFYFLSRQLQYFKSRYGILRILEGSLVNVWKNAPLTTPNCPDRGRIPGASSSSSGAKFRESGFTLLELSIYVTILVILGSPFVTLVLTSTRATSENDAVNKVEAENRKSLFRVEKELKRAIATSVVVGDSGLSLSFTPPTGFDGTGAIAGQQIRFLFRVRSGETLNGIDDNQNGVADEGELVRRNMASGEEVIIATGFDLGSSGFSQSGNTITISVN